MSVPGRAALHIAVFLGSLFILVLTDQNPRVLLYAHLVSLLFRTPLIWYAARFQRADPVSSILNHYARLPNSMDRGKPLLDSRTGKPAGLAPYMTGIPTMMFMLAVLFMLGDPTNPNLETMAREYGLAALLALTFLADDIFGRQIIIDPDASVEKNLGFNTPALNFMLAAIFIGGFLHLGLTWARVMLGDNLMQNSWMGWIVLITLSILKLTYQLKADAANPKGFAHLSRFDN